MSLCCLVLVKCYYEGLVLVFVIFCWFVLVFGVNCFRGEKYYRFLVVMLYSYVFFVDLIVMYIV